MRIMFSGKIDARSLVQFCLFLILIHFSSQTLAAPVVFTDSNLKAAVENKLGIIDPTPTDMLALGVLVANGAGITDLTGLETAANLSNLHLSFNQIIDVSPLAGLSNLIELHLRNNQVSDISVLSGLSNLARFSAPQNQISDITAMSGMVNLQNAEIWGNQIIDITALSGLSNLNWLLLTSNQIIDVSSLAGLVNLNLLSLAGNQISDITALSGLSNLSNLRLDGNQISDISALAGLSNMTILNLAGNQISDISAMSGMVDLITAVLWNNQINDISSLAGLTNLTLLRLAGNQIVDISPLAGLLSLDYLTLGSNQINNVTALASLSNLTDLRISGNQIGDISALSGLSQLTLLFASQNQISDISAISGMVNLQTLYLSGNQITDISALAGLNDLDRLRLSINQIVDISSLAGLVNLNLLFLSNNQIIDVTPLAGLGNLVDLRVNSNQIGDIYALTSLLNLTFMDARANPLLVNAYCLDIPQIETNNPGINLLVDSNPYTSCNSAPDADAGVNISIFSEDQNVTVILGIATDPESDPLMYRWLENGLEISPSQIVGPNGEAHLDLSQLASFSMGDHILTLEVTDDQETATDDMILSVGNSAPHPAPTGGGTYQYGASVSLGGQVSDFDGDLLSYQWTEGTQILFSGQVQTATDGAPVVLPVHAVSNFSLGPHNVTLTLNDGINGSVSSGIIVEITDSTNPTLAPEPNQSILWPPNHNMVDILITVNAQDNSGDPVTLSATVASNEPEDDQGDGSSEPDWTFPTIDQLNGEISLQLRAERSGSGNGRIYSVSISGTDSSGNTSATQVEILVPHSKKK